MAPAQVQLYGDLWRELGYAAALSLYVLGVVYGSRLVYDTLRGRGAPHNVAVYYVRKLIHVAAGGVVALLVPEVFGGPLVPLIMALGLGGFLAYHRLTGRLMHWFQVEDNAYEVNFTVAWGAGLAILWVALGDPRLAILPPLFIAFGDAVTGVVRNALFSRRTKHWVGNVAMALVVVPLGYVYAGPLGALAGLVASAVERLEYPPIDDNVIIVAASAAVLLAASALA